ELDLELATPFFDPARGGFWRAFNPPYLRARDAVTWLIALIAMPALVAPIAKLIWPRRRLVIPGRAILLMLITLALGPGVLTFLVIWLTHGWLYRWRRTRISDEAVESALERTRGKTSSG